MTTENQAGEPQAPTQPPAPSSSTEVHGLPAINRYGVDCEYFRKELARLYHSLDNRPVDELARYLRTLADAVVHVEGTAPAPAAPGEAVDVGTCPKCGGEDMQRSAKGWFCNHCQERPAGIVLVQTKIKAAPVSPGEPPAADQSTGPDKMVPALDLEGLALFLDDMAMTLNSGILSDKAEEIRKISTKAPPVAPPSGTGREGGGYNLAREGKRIADAWIAEGDKARPYEQALTWRRGLKEVACMLSAAFEAGAALDGQKGEQGNG